VVRDDDGRFRVHDRRVAFRHRLSIGTITSDGSVQVRYMKGGYLGAVEEAFIGRLRPRDRFQFAGRTLELVQLRDMTAYVRIAKRADGRVPRWQGGRMPLSSELGAEVEAILAAPVTRPEMRALSPLLDLQERLSELPTPATLLVEAVKTRQGWHTFVFPFAGRALGPRSAQHLRLGGERLRPRAHRAGAGLAGSAADATVAVARGADGRFARQPQPGRACAPAVPRDRARGRAAAAVATRPGTALAAAASGVQQPAVRRAAPTRPRSRAVGPGRARGAGGAARGPAPARGARALRPAGARPAPAPQPDAA